MPFAIGPQAAVCASRVASASEAAEAVALFRALLKATGDGALHPLGREGRPEQEAAKGYHRQQGQEPSSFGHAFLRMGTRRPRNPARGPTVLVEASG